MSCTAMPDDARQADGQYRETQNAEVIKNLFDDKDDKGRARRKGHYDMGNVSAIMWDEFASKQV